jgi:hypothetical protein
MIGAARTLCAHPGEATGRWSGVGTVLAGAALVSAGLWARREVRTTLTHERVTSPSDTGRESALVTGPAPRRARSQR